MRAEDLERFGLTPKQVADVMAEHTKEARYRRLLLDMGVNPKYTEDIMGVTDIGALELTEDGRTFKDVGRLAEQIKEDWGAFMFGTTPKQEAKPKAAERPSQSWETRAAELARQYHERHYGEVN